MPERCESEVGGGRRAEQVELIRGIGEGESRGWRAPDGSNNGSCRQQSYAMAALLLHGDTLMGCDEVQTCVLMEKGLREGWR